MSPLAIKIIATVVLLAACTFAALFMLSRLENPVAEFATFEEMMNSPLMQAGWIPKILPKSAYNISETHNLDTNLVQMKFQFKPGDTGIAEEKCQLVETSSEALVFRCRKGTLALTSDGKGRYTEETVSTP